MYQITESMHTLDGKTYTAYGIAYGDMRIEDLAFDRAAVEALVDLCNRRQPNSLHFRDIVEDFLAAQYQLMP